MKKLLIIVLSAVMVLGIGAITLANSFYLNFISGEYNEGSIMTTDTTGSYELGFDYLFSDKFKLGLSYANFQDDDDVFITTFSTLSFGYRVIGDDAMALDIILAYEMGNWYNDAFDINFILLGADLSYNISEQAVLGFSLATSISSNDNNSSNDKFAAILYKINFTYFFNDSFGLGIGYSSRAVTAEGPWNDVTVPGFFLGLNYRF
jgi:hypothetical protein